MKKAKYTAVLATAFAIPAIAVPATALASETTPLDSGLYFNDVNGGQGEYYSFPAWAALSDTERGLLISKYGQENIQILLNAEGYSKIATLKSISDASKPFNEASVDYEEGNITGEFINYETGESITVDPVDTPVLVESVSAINPTGVTVVVTELTEDIEGATVEVIDSEGNVREVQPVDLSAGETVVDFAFVDEVEEADLVGIWTVNGVEFNITLTQQLETFETTNSQLELYELLLELGIENVLSANAAAYLQNKADFLDELAANDEELTVSAIQQYVNDVNDSQVSETEKEAAFEAVEKALENNNLIELRAALAHPAFTKVNNAWIEDITEPDDVDGYFTELDNATDLNNADDVQDVIDTVNETVINAHITALNIATIDGGNGASETSVDKAKLNALKALIDAYAPVDQDGEFVDPTIADAYENIDIQIAVADVLSATTASTFKARVTTLAGIVNTASSTVIDLDEYVDANGKDYIDKIKEINAEKTTVSGVKDKVNTAEEIQAVINAVNAEKESDATLKLFTDLEAAILIGNPPANITTGATATQKAKFIAALNALGLEQVSSNKANVDEYINNVEDILTESKTVTDPAGDGSQPADPTKAEDAIEGIQEVIDEANLDVVKSVVNTPGTEAQLLAALAVLELDNVIEANVAAYLADEAGTIASASDAEGLQEAIDNINSAVAIAAAVDAINDAETASEVKAALDTLANQGKVSGYLNVTAADRIFIAEQVLDLRDDETDDKYADEDAVGTAVTTATEARTGTLIAVNKLKLSDSLTDIAEVLLLVGHESLTGEAGSVDAGGNVTKGNAVTANDTAIADAFISSLTFDETTGAIKPQYRSIAEVRAAIDAAIK